MRHSLALRREPTARQTQAIRARIERELSAIGAQVERGRGDLVRFKMPLPWQATRPDPMLLVTSGQVSVSAGGGGPWRVQYRLQHLRLAILCGIVSAAIAALGWSWPRLTLLQVLGVVWIVLYGVPVLVAGRRARQLLRSAASEIVERRKEPR
ncbi:MAG TPA: hypothetical protein VJ596_11910 [Gemmatimonadaceae bacterium]|nr:hypothetical protein [Gemmatimonadaceae bacterium]